MNVATAKQERVFETTVIRVVAIAPVKPGQKMAAVKDAELGWFKIWPDKLGLINRNEAYEVKFSMGDNGTRFIEGTPKHLTPHGHQPNESSEDQAAQKVAQVVKQTTQRTQSPQVHQMPTTEARAQHLDPDREKARHIYVDGVVNSSITANQVMATDRDSLMRVTANAFDVWNAVFGDD